MTRIEVLPEDGGSFLYEIHGDGIPGFTGIGSV